MDGGVLGHPRNVNPGIVCRGVQLQIVVVMNRRFDFRTDPLMDFGMTIAKGKTAGAVVIARGEVDNASTALVVRPVGLRCERCVIDAVRMLVHQEKGFDRNIND